MKGQDFFISGDLIKAYFKTLKDFSDYMNAYNNKECLKYKPVKRYNDNTLRKIIHKEYNINILTKTPIEKGNITIKKTGETFPCFLIT